MKNKNRHVVFTDDSDEEYRPKSKPQRRKVSIATKRRSTLLYLEKYGLDQPNWYTEEQQEESTINIPSPPNTPMQPKLVRNSVLPTSNQKRPPQFIKPSSCSSSSSFTKNVSIPTEFRHIHELVETYHNKIYKEGYLYKINKSNSDGTPCESSNEWESWYVELSGPILTLWHAEQQDFIVPQYINIMDSTVTLIDKDQCIFSLNSAGANMFLLKTDDLKDLVDWILAIRLSCFECSKIQEIYTLTFITRPQFQHYAKQKSGYLQARFPGKTGWKKYWVVISHAQKRLFHKQQQSQILFFESKKSKHPIMTFEKVVQAYTLYPESSKLIQVATLFKIEGHPSSSALIMASSTNDLVGWLYSIYDAFKLYGRPDALLNDPKCPKALNFADTRHHRLFLDLLEISHVDPSTHLLNNKKEFIHILQHRKPSPLYQSTLYDSDDDDSFKKPITPTTSNSDQSIVDYDMVQRKPFYAQQKSYSMNQLSKSPIAPWPMYASSGSIAMCKSPSAYYTTSIGTPSTDDDSSMSEHSKQTQKRQYNQSRLHQGYFSPIPSPTNSKCTINLL